MGGRTTGMLYHPCDRITHPLERISEPIFFDSKGGSQDENGGSRKMRMRRFFSVDVSRSAFCTLLALEKICLDNRRRGCVVLSV